MSEQRGHVSIKGERSMSQGFVAQYASLAAMQVPGVLSLATGAIVSLKEALGGAHEGKGVKVSFTREDGSFVSIDVYIIVSFGYILPDLAWEVQEKIKEDVECFTGLTVNAVNVQVMGLQAEEEEIS